jgi:hypothetical protein
MEELIAYYRWPDFGGEAPPAPARRLRRRQERRARPRQSGDSLRRLLRASGGPAR